MFKRVTLVLMFLMIPSITIAMDEVHRCIIKESHRYENDDEMRCYFAKKDLFIECCVQASKTNISPVKELLEKVRQKTINIDSPYVLMTPRDLFVRLLKNIPVELNSNKEKFPPCYTLDLNGIKTHFMIQKVSQIPFFVEPGVGYKKPEIQSMPQQPSAPIEIHEYDFEIESSCFVLPPELTVQTIKKEVMFVPATEECHSDTVGFELFSKDFTTEHAAHHQEVVALFKALIQ